MKILAINGSHRGNRGQCAYYLKLIFQGAQQAGAECEEILLSQLKINHCLACLQCHSQESLLQCIYDEKDDVRGIFNKMAEADLILFATPVYVFSMSGLLKTFLDRINAVGNSNEFRATRSGLFFHHITPAICSKPFVPLICCDNIEYESGSSIVHYFKIYAKFMDAPQVGTLIRNGGKFISQAAPVADIEIKFKQIDAAFVQAGYELASIGRIKPATQRAACQEVIPVPFFSWIKRIKSQKVKQVFIEKANYFLTTHDERHK
jgi:multimeric flavodoxin WrbA